MADNLPRSTEQTIGAVVIATAAQLAANTKFDPNTGTRLVVPCDLNVPGVAGAPKTSTYVLVSHDAALTNDRTLVGTANQVIVTDGGAKGNLTLSTPQDIAAASSPTFAGLTLGVTPLAVLYGGTGSTTAGGARTNLGLAIGTNVEAWSAQLDALSSLATTGLISRTGAGTFSTRTLTPPAAGIGVSNGDGVAGNPTISLANDLSSIEGLATTGLATRTAADTWTTRAVKGTLNRLAVTNGDGVAGAPTIDIDGAYVGQASITTLGTVATGTWGATTVAIDKGGTGQTTQQTAMDALAGAQANQKYLRSDGTHTTLTTIQAADVPTLNQNTSGTSSNVTGTVAIANGGTGQTAKTAAYDALSPTTTKGDLEVNNGTNNVRQGVGSDNQVLIADSSQANGVRWAPLAGLPSSVDVQVFTVNGTWTKPSGVSVVKVICIGAGGSGGGASGNTAGNDIGGTGGGGGAITERIFRASDLGATEAVTVGVGAAGGAGGNAASGTAGTAGGNTDFGTKLFAYGGGAGVGGTTGNTGHSGGGGGGSAGKGTDGGAGTSTTGGSPAGTAGANGISGQGAGSDVTNTTGAGRGGEYGGGSGGPTQATSRTVKAGGDSLYAAGGGGSGGNVTAGVNGSKGGGVGSYSSGGGAAGGVSGVTGGVGTAGTAGNSLKCGTGGGGGGYSTGARIAGAVGGAGGALGGGGGGGGTSTTGTGGAGGAGGRGEVRCYSW